MKLPFRQHKIQCCTTCQISKAKSKVANDGKDDMPFFYINILCPAEFLTATSVIFLAVAFILLNNNNYNTGWKFDGINYLHTYGKSFFTCIDTMLYEEGMWPSFLRQIQLNYWANIYFRISIMAPMPLRIFFAFVIRSFKETKSLKFNDSILYNFFNDLIPFVALIEVLSQVLFSVVTIRFDSATFYQYAFLVFLIGSSVYMHLKTIFTLATYNKNKEYIDVVSMIIKLITAVIYSYCALKVYPIHLKFINNIGCHAYVYKNDAIREYFLIASYLFFHLTLLIDIRKVKFLCYPSDPLENLNGDNGIELAENDC